MICVMIGSRAFSTIIGTTPVEATLRTVFLIATFSLAIPVLIPVRVDCMRSAAVQWGVFAHTRVHECAVSTWSFLRRGLLLRTH
jgi:hypothetical protein